MLFYTCRVFALAFALSSGARVAAPRHARGRVALLGVRAVSLARGWLRATHRDERLGSRLGRRRCRFPEPRRGSAMRLDDASRRPSAFRAAPPPAAVVRAAVLLGRKTSFQRRRAPDDDARGGFRRARSPVARAPRGRGVPGRAARAGGRAGAVRRVARQSVRRERGGGDVPPAPARVPRRGGRRGRGRGRALRRARRPAEPGGRGRPRRVRGGRRSAKTGEGCPRRPRLGDVARVRGVPRGGAAARPRASA